jgi:hypothetical protein
VPRRAKRSGERQANPDRRPAFGKPLEGDAAAVPLDDPVDDRQAETGTLQAARRVAAFERAAQPVRVVEALAGVA